MTERQKILLVHAGPGMRGGIETFLRTWTKNADKDAYEFTWYIPGTIIDEEFISEFRRDGVLIIEGKKCELGIRERTTWDKIKETTYIVRDVSDILNRQDFDAIHIHSGVPEFHALVLLAAKCCHVKQRISHAHGTPARPKWSKAIMEFVARGIVIAAATRYAACSRHAARYLFGRKAAGKAMIVNNCIDTEKFAFSMPAREEYRRKFGLENQFVIGHVGRFAPQKNHEFLIDIFRCVVEREQNARLLLLGTGPLEAQLRDGVERYGLSEKVIFAGGSDAVQNYMCAMDAFVLPSLWEGLPLVGIEAQANGLPCIFSDAITKEADLSVGARFVSLQEPAEVWSQEILLSQAGVDANERSKAHLKVRGAHYDIHDLPGFMKDLYAG